MIDNFYYKSTIGLLEISLENDIVLSLKVVETCKIIKRTKKQRKKSGHWPGQILQVSGQLASSISTYYDDESAIIGSNLDYTAIHQLGGQAGKSKTVSIPERPYLKLSDNDFEKN